MWLDRYRGLVVFLGLAGRVTGRKKLQKAVYIAQELGFPGLEEPFDYHWFGPYSESLACKLGELALLGVVSEREGVTQGGYPTYTYELKEEARKHFSEDVRRASAFQSAIRRLMDEDARFLELVATMRYFMKHGYDLVSAFQEVKSRKPDQNYTEADRQRAEMFLRDIVPLFDQARLLSGT